MTRARCRPRAARAAHGAMRGWAGAAPRWGSRTGARGATTARLGGLPDHGCFSSRRSRPPRWRWALRGHGAVDVQLGRPLHPVHAAVERAGQRKPGPCGLHAGGVPLAVHLVGRSGDAATLLSLAPTRGRPPWAAARPARRVSETSCWTSLGGGAAAWRGAEGALQAATEASARRARDQPRARRRRRRRAIRAGRRPPPGELSRRGGRETVPTGEAACLGVDPLD